MATQRDYQLKLVSSTDGQSVRQDRDGVTESDRFPTAAVALEALIATPGADKFFDQEPEFKDAGAWQQVACFCVCEKTGTARYLDIWDADHFDGFTHMRANLQQCVAWFSADGYTSWDSPETKSGRVNCYFTAPSAGNYLCTAVLQSYPTGANAVVNCLIDDNSFGNLPFSGTVFQPHPCALSAGGHHFRIRQVSGSYFWHSLTVWKV